MNDLMQVYNKNGKWARKKYKMYSLERKGTPGKVMIVTGANLVFQQYEKFKEHPDARWNNTRTITPRQVSAQV